MTVQTEITKSPKYAGNGATTEFAFSFKITLEDQLLVTEFDSAGATTELTLNSDYTVSFDQETESGTVTLTNPLASGKSLTIVRNTDLLQLSDYQNQQAFFPEEHEKSFDKIHQILQEQGSEISNSLKFPESEEIDGTLGDASQRANNYLAFDSSGNLFYPSVSFEATTHKTYADLATALADSALQVGDKGSVLGAGGFEVVSSNPNGRYKQIGATGRFIKPVGSPLNVGLFGVVAGADSTTEIANAVAEASGKALFFPDGNYTNNSSPSGIDDVHIVGSPRVSFTGTPLPIFNGVFTGNKEIAIVAGVIRYYSSGANGAGWYFLQDQNADHDPVLLGPITASGGASVILNATLDDFGLDPNEWTPSGFVCGPDETLAQTGVNFGASVGTDSIQIIGTYNTPKANYINYNGTDWAQTGGAGYTFSWDGGIYKHLTVTRPSSSLKGAWNGGDGVMITMRVDSSTSAANYLDAKISSVGSDAFQVTFWDKDGANVTTENTNMKFYVLDPALKNAPFNFGADPGSGTNIWMVGVFTRKPATY